MEDIEVLRRDQHHKLKSAEDIVTRAEKADRPLTDDEHKDIAELRKDAKELDGQIQQIQRDMEVRKSLQEDIKSTEAPQRRTAPTQPLNGAIPGDPDEHKPEIEFVRYGQLKAFRGPKAEERAFKSGQWIRATFYGDQRAHRYCRENGLFERAQSEGTNTAGGYTVPNVLSQTIIDLREEYGVARQLAKVVPMTSDTMEIPRRKSGLTAYFKAEATAATESSKVWGLVTLNAKKLSVLSLYSSELAEDAVIDVAEDLAMESAYALAVKEDECYFDGDGSATTYGGIRGIVNIFEAETGFAGYVNATAGVDSLGQVTATDISNLMGTCPQYAHRGAAFVCSQAAHDTIFQRLAISGGGNTIQTVSGAYQPSFLGYPIIVSQQMFSNTADTAANNKVMVLFGNFSMASTMGSRRDVRLAVSDQYKFAEDQIAIKATERMDINIHDVGDSTDAGPVVALIGNTP